MYIDLHTHILPAIDDGAATLEESLALLSQEKDNGVDTVVLTSHFRAQVQKPQEFLSARQSAYETLLAQTDGSIRLVLGAEVLYSEYLAGIENIRDFCLSGTDYLLLEMPYHAPFGEKVFSAVARLRDEHGIIPILAHVERYEAIRRDARLLYRFRELGCLMQVNADSLLEKSLSMRRFLAKLLHRGEIDLLGSDCHDPKHRPVQLSRAYQTLDDNVAHAISRMAAAVLENRRV